MIRYIDEIELSKKWNEIIHKRFELHFRFLNQPFEPIAGCRGFANGLVKAMILATDGPNLTAL